VGIEASSSLKVATLLLVWRLGRESDRPEIKAESDISLARNHLLQRTGQGLSIGCFYSIENEDGQMM
jgi:hypothetical protein